MDYGFADELVPDLRARVDEPQLVSVQVSGLFALVHAVHEESATADLPTARGP